MKGRLKNAGLRSFTLRKIGSAHIAAKGFLNNGDTITSKKVVANENTAITLGSRSPRFEA
jgi:hypothetical protein